MSGSSPTASVGPDLGGPDHRTLRDWAAATLAERIIDGTLRPGERLNEVRLAAQMGISRSPLREAIRRLEEDGLVVTRANHASVVAPLSLEEFHELYQVRSPLELLAAREAARRMPLGADDIEAALAALRALHEAPAPPTHAFVAADLALHRAIWRAAGNRLLLDLLQRLARRVRRYILAASVSGTFVGLDDSLADHQRLVEAVLAGDPDRAETAMRAHMEGGRQRLLSAWAIRHGGWHPARAGPTPGGADSMEGDSPMEAPYGDRDRAG